MCSIEGFTGKHSEFNISQFSKFNSDRGPDGFNSWEDQHVSIGHNLLSIQHLGNNIAQPLIDSSGGVLSYNGEIYDLNTFDTSFISDVMCSNRLDVLKHEVNGMFAISYYNPNKKTITLIRDHLGVKPLYYMELNGDFFWSSTEKPLIAVLNAKQKNPQSNSRLHAFVNSDGWIYPPYSLYSSIRSVAPGGIMVWDMKTKKLFRGGSMWDGFDLWPNQRWDAEEYEDICYNALKSTMHAPDIPKAVSLSGGVDSALVAGCAKNEDNLFAVSVSYEYDIHNIDPKRGATLIGEHKRAMNVAQRINIPLHIANHPIDTKDMFEPMVSALGGWYSMGSRLSPRYVSAKTSAAHGAKIWATGDLADELVTGVGRDNFFRGPNIIREEDYRPRPGTHFLAGYVGGYAGLKKSLQKGPEQYQGDILNWVCFLQDAFSVDGINNMLFLRHLLSCHNYNSINDRFAGAFGMESRSPYSYQKLVKYVLKIPSSYKFGSSSIRDKPLLRKHMARHIPDFLRTFGPKAGFCTPHRDDYDHNLNLKIKEQEVKRAVTYCIESLTFD